SSQDNWEKSGGRYAHSVARRRGWAMSDVTCLAVLALALYPGQRPPAASGASLFVTRQVFLAPLPHPLSGCPRIRTAHRPFSQPAQGAGNGGAASLGVTAGDGSLSTSARVALQVKQVKSVAG